MVALVASRAGRGHNLLAEISDQTTSILAAWASNNSRMGQHPDSAPPIPHETSAVGLGVALSRECGGGAYGSLAKPSPMLAIVSWSIARAGRGGSSAKCAGGAEAVLATGSRTSSQGAGHSAITG